MDKLVINGGGRLMGYDSRTNKVTQILEAEKGQNRPIICRGTSTST